MHFDGVCAKIYKPCTFMECTLFAVKNEEVSVAMSNHNEKYEKLASVIEEHRTQKGGLMPVLQEAQAIFGYVPRGRAGDHRRRTGHDAERGLRRGHVLFPVLSGAQGPVRRAACAWARPATSRAPRRCWTSWCEELKIRRGQDHGGRHASPCNATRCLGACGLAPGYDDQRRSLRPPDARRNSRHPGQV